jgi:hypothetical protein
MPCAGDRDLKFQVSSFKSDLFSKRIFNVWIRTLHVGARGNDRNNFRHLLWSGWGLIVICWPVRCGSEHEHEEMTRGGCTSSAGLAERFAASSQKSSLYVSTGNLALQQNAFLIGWCWGDKCLHWPFLRITTACQNTNSFAARPIESHWYVQVMIAVMHFTVL